MGFCCCYCNCSIWNVLNGIEPASRKIFTRSSHDTCPLKTHKMSRDINTEYLLCGWNWQWSVRKKTETIFLFWKCSFRGEGDDNSKEPKTKNDSITRWRVANCLVIWHFWTFIIAVRTICLVFKHCDAVETDNRKYWIFFLLACSVRSFIAIHEVEVISFPFVVVERLLEIQKVVNCAANGANSLAHTSSSCKIVYKCFIFVSRLYN